MAVVCKNGCKFSLIDGFGSVVIDEVFDKDVYSFNNVPNNSVVVDIGANLGAFSVRCAVHKNCTVYSYEPGKRNFEVLVSNLALNNVADRVHPFNLAVADSVGIREFYYYKNHPAGSSLFKPLDIPFERYEVQTVTLEDVLLNNGLNHIDFLKIDAEGSENLIFTPRFAPVLKKIGRIAAEWHTQNGRALSNFFNSIGFSTVITDEQFMGGILLASNNE